jgi:PPOX class probable F420-dependent enzyme
MPSSLDTTKERDAHIEQRLRTDEVIWLNTVRPDGRPHSVVVWFLWNDDSILIFSQPDKQKVLNLRSNPNVVLALDNTNNGADPITIEGTATLLPHGEVDTTLSAYTEKYAEGMKGINMTAEQMAQSFSQAIRITPKRFL